jgi:hypothetical protein
MTKGKKRTVFISSTFEDLTAERRKIWELLSSYDVNVRGMERFGARKASPLETCIAEVEQSDIYVGIISYRLGSIEPKTGKSYTQLEYEKALETNKDIWFYIKDDKNSKISPLHIDFGEKHEKLQSFKSIIKERHTIDLFSDEIDLQEKLKRKFDDVLKRKQSEDATNEYEKSKTIINRFLLVPKAYSGREILVKGRFMSGPFPASKAICSAFNFEYGKTIGIDVFITEPDNTANHLQYVFTDYSNIDRFLGISIEDELEFYCQLQFSENPVSSEKANFKDVTYSYMNMSFNATGMESKTIKAEGAIILKFIDFKKP